MGMSMGVGKAIDVGMGREWCMVMMGITMAGQAGYIQCEYPV